MSGVGLKYGDISWERVVIFCQKLVRACQKAAAGAVLFPDAPLKLRDRDQPPVAALNKDAAIAGYPLSLLRRVGAEQPRHDTNMHKIPAFHIEK